MNINITSFNTKCYHETSSFLMNMDKITYKIKNDDTVADTFDSFYPIHCQQGKDQKILRLHNDGEIFSLNSISNDHTTHSVQLAADCFRLGKTIIQFPRLCRPQSPISLSPSLTADCLAGQNKKLKTKLFNEVPLEEWRGDTAPFCAIHIDHKGPLHPPGNQNTHCLLIVDPFSWFLMAHHVTNTGAQDTTAAVEKWIFHFGIPQLIILDRGTAFLNTDFFNWTKVL